MSQEIYKLELTHLIKNYMNDAYLKGFYAKNPPTKRQVTKLHNETNKAKYALERILKMFKDINLNIEIEQLDNGRFHTEIVRNNGYKTSYSTLNQKSIWPILDKLDFALSMIAEHNFSNNLVTLKQ